MQTEGTIEALSKSIAQPSIIAQCNLQVLWLLKNKDLSHWVKLYSDISEKTQSIGQLKIKTSFFKNRSFGINEVSNVFSADRTKERTRQETLMHPASNQTFSERSSVSGFDLMLKKSQIIEQSIYLSSTDDNEQYDCSTL